MMEPPVRNPAAFAPAPDAGRAVGANATSLVTVAPFLVLVGSFDLERAGLCRDVSAAAPVSEVCRFGPVERQRPLAERARSAITRQPKENAMEVIILQPIVALIAGILFLIVPHLLNYIVAVYLIVIGLVGLLKHLA
jgi:Protein of unknown function (DUF3096)